MPKMFTKGFKPKSTTKKAKGIKKLTKTEMNFYQGAINGFQEYYDKNILKVR